ncbi:hypothetical protein RHMOL_Rhmol07G0243600 [Rhododendron molle]|uniref:Uncharacterized protein n=1 Tax=Rhododendron molle TaxID=49168 RepID=A0ACC0N5Y3_RHOML|nr:hypothetical protein RHMOL_Rhmol07G0243600 [Rhododendron molle]
MSGLKINFSKSLLCGVKVNHQEVTSLARVMGCKVDHLPIKYLGLPLGANPNRIRTWDPVVERMEKRLSVWRGRFNTSGERLTLLNSSLSSLPIYFMSLFKMPVAVAKVLEKIQRQFFWGDTMKKRKLHLVKWELITKKKEFGGLGVKNLMIQNLALLAKWWWRFYKDSDSLWVKVVKSKYKLEQSCWLPRLPSSGKSSTIWKDICSVGDSSSVIGSILQEGFRVVVHSGQDISFWNQVWLGNTTLKEEFPRLYLISTQKEKVIRDLKDANGDGRWNLLFQRSLRDWEAQQFDDLLMRLQVVILDQSRRDMMCWRWAFDNCFSVKSVYNKWEQMGLSSNRVMGSIWKNICPPKVEIFAWLALQDRVASRSVLLSRNLIPEGQSVMCPRCSFLLETPGHLFLHCPFSWLVWSLILDWWHVSWVCPASLVDLFSWWLGMGFKNLEKYMWETTFHATIWSLWLVRNDLVFNNATWRVEDLGELIKTRVAMCIKVKFDIKVHSVEDFKDYLDGMRKVTV